MPIIMPIKDLRNTTEISNLAHNHFHYQKRLQRFGCNEQ